MLDAVLLFVGQAVRVDDDTRTTLEARELFAAALRLARQRYGRETGQGEITQKSFAGMLGISGERPEERYRLYESADREPPLWILAALRRVTGYSLDGLIAQLPAGRPLAVTSATPRVRKPPKPKPKERPPKRPTMGGNVARNPAKPDCEANVAKRRVVRLVEAERP